MKVIATDESFKTGIQVKELGRVANPGEVFEIEFNRLPILMGQNKWGKIFVNEYKEPKKEEPVVEVKAEEPKAEVKKEVKEAPKTEVKKESKPASKKAPAKKPATKKASK